MEQTTLSVRIDSKDKKGFEAFCNSTGMNVSTAINMFVKAVLREQRLPFEIKSDFNNLVYSKLLEAEEEMNLNTKKYTSEEVMKILKQSVE